MMSRLLAIVAMALVTALTASLGQWQMRRAAEKRAQQSVLERAAQAGPYALDGRPLAAGQISGRLVQLQGRFIPDDTIFIDNRTHQGVAGFYVLTPVKIKDSSLHVLVLRGWIARDVQDRNRLPMVKTPADDVQIAGIAEPTLERTLELKSDARAAARRSAVAELSTRTTIGAVRGSICSPSSFASRLPGPPTTVWCANGERPAPMSTSTGAMRCSGS
jgi:cytochrome oxidase assembly protein ShyY1